MNRTVAIVRLLRATGLGVRRRGRLPRQQQPDTIRLDYYRAIQRAACEPARVAFERVAPEILRLLEDWNRGRKRDVAEDDRAKVLLDRAAERVVTDMRPSQLHDIAKTFGKRTSDFQRTQLDRQVRQAMSVPLSAVERPIREKLDDFARENVALIKTIPERYFDSLRERVQDAFASGTHPETLAEEFRDRYDVSLSNARRMARDQIGKLNSEMNQERQRAMGVTSYIWRTAKDERVRGEHRDREGKTYKWSDPPEDGHPGEPIQCRCFSEPNFDDILEAVDTPRLSLIPLSDNP